MIEQLVNKFIQKYNFENYVIAYSGGVDSQVLLHAFAKVVPEKVIAYHVNHGISDNAKDWENFCFEHAESLSVDFHVSRFSLLGESNLEDKARQVRYGAFKSIMTSKSVLVTGHHMDDQVETFMLNLMRGAGIDGLSAMPEIKDFGVGFHGRPFLSVTKADIKEYALKHNLSWVEDESNADSTYDRNFIRNEVMPLLKTRWSGASEAICNSVEHVQNAKSYIDTKVNELGIDYKNDKINIEELMMLNSYEQTETVRKWVYFNLGKPASKNMLKSIFENIIPASDDAKMKWEQKDYFITRFNGFIYYVKKDVVSYDIQSILDKSFDGLSVSDVVVKFGCLGEKIKQGNIHKEVKKLFQEYKVPTWIRKDLPYIYHNDELLSVGGLINKK